MRLIANFQLPIANLKIGVWQSTIGNLVNFGLEPRVISLVLSPPNRVAP